jgi:integrase
MSVRVKSCEGGKWQVDIRYRLPNGRRARTRHRVRVSSKTAAKRWGEERERNLFQQRMPCTIKLLPVPKSATRFYDFEEYERLVEAARLTDARAHLITLLGGEAGLRCGEMVALEWSDVDLTKRQLCIQRSAWKGQITVPKGGRLRYVPLTVRLVSALREFRHLRGPRVLYQDDGRPLTEKGVQRFLRQAARRAGVDNNGPHILRHTFCSHLAMKGAPARAVQELAGHVDLMTTQRYMHLSPAALDSAIRLLDGATSGAHGSGEVAKSS